jgi:TusA-related sulfurtransferase
MNLDSQPAEAVPDANIIRVDACGLHCPNPIVKLESALEEAKLGDIIEFTTTDASFARDLAGFCRRTGHHFEGIHHSKGVSTARIQKGSATASR